MLGVAQSSRLSPLASIGPRSKVVSVSLDQLRADLRSLAGAPQQSQVPAAALLGCWVDTVGNTVLVQSDGEPSQQLTASLMKPPRTDIHLSLWQTTDGGVWHCGDAVLDAKASTPEQLTWVFRDGSISSWTWTAFTLEALAARGLTLPQDAFPGSPAVAYPRPAFTTNFFHDGVPQEWVPLCVALDQVC